MTTHQLFTKHAAALGLQSPAEIAAAAQAYDRTVADHMAKTAGLWDSLGRAGAGVAAGAAKQAPKAWNAVKTWWGKGPLGTRPGAVQQAGHRAAAMTRLQARNPTMGWAGRGYNNARLMARPLTQSRVGQGLGAAATLSAIPYFGGVMGDAAANSYTQYEQGNYGRAALSAAGGIGAGALALGSGAGALRMGGNALGRLSRWVRPGANSGRVAAVENKLTGLKLMAGVTGAAGAGGIGSAYNAWKAQQDNDAANGDALAPYQGDEQGGGWASGLGDFAGALISSYMNGQGGQEGGQAPQGYGRQQLAGPGGDWINDPGQFANSMGWGRRA